MLLSLPLASILLPCVSCLRAPYRRSRLHLDQICISVGTSDAMKATPRRVCGWLGVRRRVVFGWVRKKHTHGKLHFSAGTGSVSQLRRCIR